MKSISTGTDVPKVRVKTKEEELDAKIRAIREAEQKRMQRKKEVEADAEEQRLAADSARARVSVCTRYTRTPSPEDERQRPARQTRAANSASGRNFLLDPARDASAGDTSGRPDGSSTSQQQEDAAAAELTARRWREHQRWLQERSNIDQQRLARGRAHDGGWKREWDRQKQPTASEREEASRRPAAAAGGAARPRVQSKLGSDGAPRPSGGAGRSTPGLVAARSAVESGAGRIQQPESGGDGDRRRRRRHRGGQRRRGGAADERSRDAAADAGCRRSPSPQQRTTDCDRRRRDGASPQQRTADGDRRQRDRAEDADRAQRDRGGVDDRDPEREQRHEERGSREGGGHRQVERHNRSPSPHRNDMRGQRSERHHRSPSPHREDGPKQRGDRHNRSVSPHRGDTPQQRRDRHQRSPSPHREDDWDRSQRSPRTEDLSRTHEKYHQRLSSPPLEDRRRRQEHGKQSDVYGIRNEERCSRSPSPHRVESAEYRRRRHHRSPSPHREQSPRQEGRRRHRSPSAHHDEEQRRREERHHRSPSPHREDSFCRYREHAIMTQFSADWAPEPHYDELRDLREFEDYYSSDERELNFTGMCRTTEEVPNGKSGVNGNTGGSEQRFDGTVSPISALLKTAAPVSIPPDGASTPGSSIPDSFAQRASLVSNAGEVYPVCVPGRSPHKVESQRPVCDPDVVLAVARNLSQHLAGSETASETFPATIVPNQGYTPAPVMRSMGAPSVMQYQVASPPMQRHGYPGQGDEYCNLPSGVQGHHVISQQRQCYQELAHTGHIFPPAQEYGSAPTEEYSRRSMRPIRGASAAPPSQMPDMPQISESIPTPDHRHTSTGPVYRASPPAPGYGVSPPPVTSAAPMQVMPSMPVEVSAPTHLHRRESAEQAGCPVVQGYAISPPVHQYAVSSPQEFGTPSHPSIFNTPPPSVPSRVTATPETFTTPPTDFSVPPPTYTPSADFSTPAASRATHEARLSASSDPKDDVYEAAEVVQVTRITPSAVYSVPPPVGDAARQRVMKVEQDRRRPEYVPPHMVKDVPPVQETLDFGGQWTNPPQTEQVSATVRDDTDFSHPPHAHPSANVYAQNQQCTESNTLHSSANTGPSSGNCPAPDVSEEGWATPPAPEDPAFHSPPETSLAQQTPPSRVIPKTLPKQEKYIPPHARRPASHAAPPATVSTSPPKSAIQCVTFVDGKMVEGGFDESVFKVHDVRLKDGTL